MNPINTSAKKKVAIVVQRYGRMINGGAEAHAHAIAERLSSHYDITILTSRAIDHHRWKPELPEGKETENGITIIRFNHPSKGLSTANALAYLFLKCLFAPYSLFQKRKLKQGKRKPSVLELSLDRLKLMKQGPCMPELLTYIDRHSSAYDVFIFFTYLYYPTAMGIFQVAKKSILVPTIHDEPAVYRGIYQKLMTAPAQIFFNTESELEFSGKIFELNINKTRVVGSGIDMPSIEADQSVLDKYRISKPYILYVGRVDAGKGCRDLVIWHEKFVDKHDADLGLVMVGKNHLDIKGKAIFTDFISEEEKNQIISQSIAVTVPSKYESLSLALLEGFAFGKPGLVNSNCEVLITHINNSNAGWCFSNFEEFEKSLLELIKYPEMAVSMGEKGKSYVYDNYNWSRIMKQYTETIEKIISSEQVFNA